MIKIKIATISIIALLIFSAQAKLMKVSDRGIVIKDNAAKWSCVLDDKTKLIWEVKTSDKDLHYDKSTYVWFDGKFGVESSKYSNNCILGKYCNTNNFIDSVNKTNLCNIKGWRLPTFAELQTLVIYGDAEPLINTNYFPNTQKKSYWSADTDKNDENIALDVPFFYGGSVGTDKSFDSYVRLVKKVKKL